MGRPSKWGRLRDLPAAACTSQGMAVLGWLGGFASNANAVNSKRMGGCSFEQDALDLIAATCNAQGMEAEIKRNGVVGRFWCYFLSTYSSGLGSVRHLPVFESILQ